MCMDRRVVVVVSVQYQLAADNLKIAPQVRPFTDAPLSVYSAVDLGESCGVLSPRWHQIRLELWLALVFPVAIASVVVAHSASACARAYDMCLRLV